MQADVRRDTLAVRNIEVFRKTFDGGFDDASLAACTCVHVDLRARRRLECREDAARGTINKASPYVAHLLRRLCVNLPSQCLTSHRAFLRRDRDGISFSHDQHLQPDYHSSRWFIKADKEDQTKT